MQIYFAYAIALTGMMGMKAGRVLLSLYALRLGAHPVAIGLLASSYSIFPVLVSFQAGKWTDRFGARWLVTLGAVCAALGLSVPAVIPSLAAVFIAAALSGLSTTFYNVSLQNLVGLLSNAENRARYFSNYSLVLAIASFIGPLFIGFVIDHFGYSISCWSLATLAMLPAGMLLLWGRTLPAGSRKAAAVTKERGRISASDIFTLLVTGGLVQIGLDMFQFYIPVYGDSLRFTAGSIGMIVAMFSAAAFVVRSVMPLLLKRYSSETVLRYAFYLGAVSFLLVPFFSSTVALGLVSFAFGMGMGLGQPLTMMMTFSSSSSGRSGEALGLRLTVNQITRLVGPVLFGVVGSTLGLPAIFWVNAILLAAGGVLSRSNEGTPVGGPAESRDTAA